VMLTQIIAIAFPASLTLILGRHIQVELLITRLSNRTQAVISSFALLLGFGLFVLIILRLYLIGYSFQTSGEQSHSAHIPYYPFAYGIALASIPVCLVYLQKLFSSLKKVVKG
jgi:TRAP-type C4-dicarboxylate transport system permease small subunit